MNLGVLNTIRASISHEMSELCWILTPTLRKLHMSLANYALLSRNSRDSSVYYSNNSDKISTLMTVLNQKQEIENWDRYITTTFH